MAIIFGDGTISGLLAGGLTDGSVSNDCMLYNNGDGVTNGAYADFYFTYNANTQGGVDSPQRFIRYPNGIVIITGYSYVPGAGLTNSYYPFALSGVFSATCCLFKTIDSNSDWNTAKIAELTTSYVGLRNTNSSFPDGRICYQVLGYLNNPYSAVN